MHTSDLIFDLAVILGTAAVVTFLFRKIRQPVVLGYIVAGMIVGPFTPPYSFVKDIPSIQVWSELGVVFLMFALGLEFTFEKLTRVGAPATGTALIEVLGMGVLGVLSAKLFGWSTENALFLGGILAISSTTIIIKALDELKLRHRPFADVVFGVLIVEDLFAILILVALNTFAAKGNISGLALIGAALKLVSIVGSWFLIGRFLIPGLLRYAGKLLDDEALTILATGLCLMLVVIAGHFHYSPALGAFIMGSILAETEQAERIDTLIRPIKSLFAAVFFVSVGMLVDPSKIAEHWFPVIVLTIITIVGKIGSSTLGALISGQPIRSAVQIGFSLAQIGELSFIIATLGISLGVTSDFLYPIAVAVSVITTFSTPYLIRIADPCGSWLESNLPREFRETMARYSARMRMRTERS